MSSSVFHGFFGLISYCNKLCPEIIMSSDLRHFSKAFMTAFIELYKSFPCLWKTKSRDYKDRNKKDSAYMVLLKKLQEIEPNATKKTVKAKINSIRGSFRREMKKIEKSKRSGTGADDVYVTHLWYYDLLLFTNDQEMPRESVSNLDENRENESGSEREADDESEHTQGMEHIDEDVESPMNPPARCLSRSSVPRDLNQNISSPSTSATSSAATRKSSKRKCQTKVDEADEVLTMVGERLRNQKADDAFNIFGNNVAAKLRTLPRQTRLYTEKLINDLLFEAEMGNIDKHTKIVTSVNTSTNSNDTNNSCHTYLPSNEYPHPATHRPVQHQVHPSSQRPTDTQFPMTPTPQQHLYQNLETSSPTSQYNSNISTFYGTYQPSEDNN
ncbi:uncharacterized protein [Leptinotarsa decemlineata]|uniref:uncharacterized protein n=1 Tax=Leptinotarsa decemlineata TaxID=7539 RepID=UPI003D306FEA